MQLKMRSIKLNLKEVTLLSYLYVEAYVIDVVCSSYFGVY